jgi:heme-degrading monooxygenase HmoA
VALDHARLIRRGPFHAVETSEVDRERAFPRGVFAMPFVANTPKPPYYAVVFTSLNAPDVDHTEHVAMYQRLVKIAESYEGYLGIEPARNSDGSGVAVVYWKDLKSIAAWARDPEHVVAKRKGREIWYSHYMIRICKVERDYGRPDWSQE